MVYIFHLFETHFLTCEVCQVITSLQSINVSDKILRVYKFIPQYNSKHIKYISKHLVKIPPQSMTQNKNCQKYFFKTLKLFRLKMNTIRCINVLVKLTIHLKINHLPKSLQICRGCFFFTKIKFTVVNQTNKLFKSLINQQLGFSNSWPDLSLTCRIEQIEWLQNLFKW